MNVPQHNRKAWDRLVEQQNKWTVPASPLAIAEARSGKWAVVLTPYKPVPRDWFGRVEGARILCLASGGGQQGPILSAAGAIVTVLDNSPAQLAQDRSVADREQLAIRTELGEMTDLSRFADDSFDIVFHPVANVFIADVLPMWRECFRVLRPGGRLLAGITNPLVYLFDEASSERGKDLVVVNKIPYSDLESLPSDERQRKIANGETLQFSHTLEDQLGGQLAAGFTLAGLYEDRHDNNLDRFISTFIATLAVKP